MTNASGVSGNPSGPAPQLMRSVAAPARREDRRNHYDPYSATQPGGTPRLFRQGMDFLMLLPRRVRVVVEIDGKQYYSDEDGTTNPAPYEVVQAPRGPADELVPDGLADARDRRLRQCGLGTEGVCPGVPRSATCWPNALRRRRCVLPRPVSRIRCRRRPRSTPPWTHCHPPRRRLPRMGSPGQHAAAGETLRPRRSARTASVEG